MSIPAVPTFDPIPADQAVTAPVALVADVTHDGKGTAVELASILDEIVGHLDRWVSFPSPECRDAVAAWIVHAWVLYCEADDSPTFDSTPRLAVLSPVKQCGKTRLLDVLYHLVPEPAPSVAVSPASIYRLIDAEKPTILLDEADTIWNKRNADQNEDLRGLLNAGHRRGMDVPRCDGPQHKIKRFRVFGPLVIAGIGDVPDTVLDRSIIIPMRRRAPGEVIAPFRYTPAKELTLSTRTALDAWATREHRHFETARPEMPQGITDRPADVWEPLIAIGDYAGSSWSERIRHACVTLNAERSDRDANLGTRLLSACRTAFGADDRVATDDLIRRLVALEDEPWGDLYGKPLDSRKLARLLKPFQVTPGAHRFGDGTLRGYLREDFHDAWARYLEPANTPSTPSEEAQQAQQALLAGWEDEEIF